MTVVLADPAGFAVDWNWQRHLTVWALAGRPAEPRFESQVLEHDLPDLPASERQAQSATRRWWREQGRIEALAAHGEGASPPGH